MIGIARIGLLLATMIACVGCDQVSKAAARNYLRTGVALSFFNDTVRLQHAENPGAFLSLGASLPIRVRSLLFTSGGALLVGCAVFWAVRARGMTPLQTIAAALACGGGLGNLIDRWARHGYVTDFLNLGIGPVRTGIFNVADFALLLGLGLLVWRRRATVHAGKA